MKERIPFSLLLVYLMGATMVFLSLKNYFI